MAASAPGGGGNQHLGGVIVLSRTSAGVRTKYMMHYLDKAVKDNMCTIVIMTKFKRCKVGTNDPYLAHVAMLRDVRYCY